ncbi:carboxypeptidase Y inhibitor [Purpureocillium takamizusanense]|uniref:Carboxypeptidase Y inhibitor n=1 Tax=Purpureocillium takamizusanense TaxID=2060973 RepID=A0A9Q8Q9U3_9HYPO|nr:carboxypeptidase Y inhibitor [Purpureocillium takamizusanense]UNI15061.1 carboxypeptidase Y inhibitor [Purpureocillium takamizusanense]
MPSTAMNDTQSRALGSRGLDHQTAVAITDELLFKSTLEEFLARRDNRDPPELDWNSDGCTASPDNPSHFPFLPACYRHDFGYRNYKAQDRFKAGRARIDANFKHDLNHQCEYDAIEVEAEPVGDIGAGRGKCKALANAYYAAVRLLGGLAIKRDEHGLVKEYEDALAAYNDAVRNA